VEVGISQVSITSVSYISNPKNVARHSSPYSIRPLRVTMESQQSIATPTQDSSNGQFVNMAIVCGDSPMESINPSLLATSSRSASLSPSPSPGEAAASVDSLGSDALAKPPRKRRSWGQPLPEPTTCLPPRKRAKTDAEKEQRRVERIKRNRLAAQTSRERKRLELENLQKQYQDLEMKCLSMESVLKQYQSKFGPLGEGVVVPDFSSLLSSSLVAKPPVTALSPAASMHDDDSLLTPPAFGSPLLSSEELPLGTVSTPVADSSSTPSVVAPGAVLAGGAVSAHPSHHSAVMMWFSGLQRLMSKASTASSSSTNSNSTSSLSNASSSKSRIPPHGTEFQAPSQTCRSNSSTDPQPRLVPLI